MSEELKQEVEARAPVPSRASMRKEDFEDHGYTPNCPGCASILLKRHYIIKGTLRHVGKEWRNV